MAKNADALLGERTNLARPRDRKIVFGEDDAFGGEGGMSEYE